MLFKKISKAMRKRSKNLSEIFLSHINSKKVMEYFSFILSRENTVLQKRKCSSKDYLGFALVKWKLRIRLDATNLNNGRGLGGFSLYQWE